jgi:hypothetical protein
LIHCVWVGSKSVAQSATGFGSFNVLASVERRR